jgi:hypothetical protein
VKTLLVIVLACAGVAALFHSAWRDRKLLNQTNERRRKPQREEAAYAVKSIRAFLEGGTGTWDWDDFTSCPLSDPQLDTIRKRALAVGPSFGPDERATLETLADEAERLARN